MIQQGDRMFIFQARPRVVNNCDVPPKETVMRLLLLVLGISVCVVGIGTRAEAQNYPWCAHYGTGFGGINCGFTTFQQCMDTVSGIGGFCMVNNT